MKAKQLILVSALLATGMTAACTDKQDTASKNATSAPSTPQTQPVSAAANPPGQAEQANTQQSISTQDQAPDSDGLMRVHFDDVFAVTADGNLSPKVPVDINGVQMTPGVTFGGGVQFGGFALSQAAGHDLGVRRLPTGFLQLVKYYT